MLYKDSNMLLKGIKTMFAVLLSKVAASVLNRIAFFSESTTDKELYLFLNALPGIKEWIDKIQWGDLETFKYEIVNKKFYGGAILVDRDTLEDSGYEVGGSILMAIKSGINKWKSFPAKLINTLLTNGASGLAFDGTAFFAADRLKLKGSTAINNIVTGTGTTLAQLSTDLSSAKVQLVGLRDKNGDPFNDEPKFLAYIPSQLMDKFAILRDAETVDLGAGQITNVHKGTFDFIVNWQQTTTDNDWYLINENAPVPPFVVQQRKAPKWNEKDDPEDANIKYWSDSRLNAGYGNPMAIVKINN